MFARVWLFTCSRERQRVEREHGARDEPFYTGFGHSEASSFVHSHTAQSYQGG